MIVQAVHGYPLKGHAVSQATVSHIMEQPSAAARSSTSVS